MSYCGICNNNNVTFTKVEGGFYCSGCDEIQYDDEMDRCNTEKTLKAAKRGKNEGWKIYPNIEGSGRPIDEVINEYEEKLRTSDLNKQEVCRYCKSPNILDGEIWTNCQDCGKSFI